MHISIRQLISLLLVIIGVLSLTASIYSVGEVKSAALESQERTLLRVVDVAQNEIDLDLKDLSSRMSNLMQQDKAIRKRAKAVIKGNESAKPILLEAIDEASRQSLVTTGLIDLISVRVYTKSFELVSEWDKNARLADSASHQGVIKRLKARSRTESPLVH